MALACPGVVVSRTVPVGPVGETISAAMALPWQADFKALVRRGRAMTNSSLEERVIRAAEATLAEQSYVSQPRRRAAAPRLARPDAP